MPLRTKTPKPPLAAPLPWAMLLATLLLPRGAGALDVGHDIAVHLHPGSHRLEGVDRLTLAGAGTAELRLPPGMEVTAMTLDGRPHSGTAIRLDGDAPRLLEIRYRAVMPPGDGAGPRIDPEGSFLPGDAGWFPIIEADDARYAVTVTVPPGQTAVVTGSLVEETSGPDGYRALFETRHPEPPSLFAGPYRVVERRQGGLRLRAYLHETAAPLADDYLTRSAALIEHFAQRIGPYPFDHFHVVSAPLPVGLGFPGLTYIDRRILPLPFIRDRSLPHEVLHNWWGSGVMVEPASGNWAEGLTTFMADHGLADEAARRRLRQDWLRDYAALPEARDHPLRAFLGRVHDADQIVGYGKGAFVFHMLQHRIGEAAFEAGLRRFWQRHRMETAGWEDLRRAFEDSSSQELGGFFAQWLDRPGAPRLLPPEGHAEGRSVVLTLRQEAPAYALSIPVAVETPAGTERHAVRLDSERRTVRLDTAATPLAVEIDPDHDLFRRLLPGEMPAILRDVTLADPVSVVIAAEGEAADAASRLARRLLGPSVQRVDALPPDRPALFIGTHGAWARHPDVARIPPSLAGRGTAQVWAERPAEAPPRLWVAAEDAAAIEALLRPLPHYGRRGWLVLDGGKVVDQGAWPVLARPMRLLLP